MLRIALIATLCLLQSAASAAPSAMTASEARHLLSRTGFGAAPHEIKALVGLSYSEGVARVMADVGGTPHIPMPTWVDDWAYPYDQIWVLDQTTTDLFYANRWAELEALSAWWMAEMAATPSPLTERMVLFWSDHFATNFDAHENSQWTAKQNQFFRTHAAGNFRDLAAGILHDPAMLVFLDNVSNIADAPNENLGREFLELFTLGEGRGYTQDDVRAAARILTGTTLTDTGAPKVILDKETFDAGRKTLFGKTGAFMIDDLVEMTLEHPEFGPYIVEKLWLTFISDTPNPAEVARLVTIWQDNDLELAPLLEAMFLSDAFWDKANRGRLVKSPLEMVIGTTRSLGLARADARDLIWMLEDLGQKPFMPPNVGGWPEGIGWINDATASGRATALTYMLSDREVGIESASTAMMMAETSQDIVTIDSTDLRVGQVFANYIEPRDPGEGYGGAFTLYDVGFAGHDWRSITFWMEHDDTEDFTSLYLHTGDCAPDCFANLPKDDDDPDWVGFVPWEGMITEYPEVSGHDIALMQAIGTHLPALIASTEGQLVFRYNPDTPDDPPADIVPMIAAAASFARANADLIGDHQGSYVQGFSRPNVLGLAGLDVMMSGGDMDAYREKNNVIPLRPAVTFDTAQDWINALPGTGPQSARAAKALLSVPRGAQGLREELIVEDPDALLRSLILSPAYQVK